MRCVGTFFNNGQLPFQDLREEVSVSAGWLQKTTVDALGLLFYEIAHCLYFTVGCEYLAVVGNTFFRFYLAAHVASFGFFGTIEMMRAMYSSFRASGSTISMSVPNWNSQPQNVGAIRTCTVASMA